jgi:glycosyltransferase involved in cell wall biosynthesis
VRLALIREGICSAEKIEVLGEGSINGIDAAGRFDPARFPASARAEIRRDLRIPDTATVVGFVGRLTGEKGMRELHQAWLRLRAEHASLHLLLVGPEDSVTPLPAQMMEALRGDARVHLVGMDWNTAPLYAAMDILVLPTYREGFPVVLLEAASMALPIVATAVPGCIDAVVDGVTGLLVPAKDAEALYGAMERYVSDQALRRSHGDAARSRVLEHFPQERIWAELLKRYRMSPAATVG